MDAELSEEERKALAYPLDSDFDRVDNSLSVYEKVLDFDRSKLENKRVLDLGTGRTDRLARELKEAGINTAIVGISPDLLTSAAKDDLKRLFPEWRRSAVHAIAQRLPFRDESFDVVLGLYSISYYSSDPEQVRAWVAEIGRILKPGGEARLGPICKDFEDTRAVRAFGVNNQILINAAENAGLGIKTDKNLILMEKPLHKT